MVAFLVEHPSAGPLLVDTGFHPSVAVDPKQAMGRLGGLLFKDVRMDADDAVAGQLRSRGIDPQAIETVVMTHLHSDHASGIAEFPDARFVVSAQEWEAASKGREIDGYMRRQFDHAFDYRLVDLAGATAGSFATFGRSLDLFGDGSVRLVFTPGHTHGHCAVVLRLDGREALICGDAAYTMRTIEESHLPFKMADEHRFRALAERDPAVHRADTGRGGHPGARHGRVAAAGQRVRVATRTPAPRRRGTRPAGRRSHGR